MTRLTCCAGSNVTREKSPFIGGSLSAREDQSGVDAGRHVLFESQAQERGPLRFVQVVVHPDLRLVVGPATDLRGARLRQAAVVGPAVAGAHELRADAKGLERLQALAIRIGRRESEGLDRPVRLAL